MTDWLVQRHESRPPAIREDVPIPYDPGECWIDEAVVRDLGEGEADLAVQQVAAQNPQLQVAKRRAIDLAHVHEYTVRPGPPVVEPVATE